MCVCVFAQTHLWVHHTGKCIRRFAGIFAHCWYFIDVVDIGVNTI